MDRSPEDLPDDGTDYHRTESAYGIINQDGSAGCPICGGTTNAHRRLELASGQLIPCPWVDDDDLPDVWASAEQFAADVWTNRLTQAQRDQFVDDAFACDLLEMPSELDAALVGVLVYILRTPVVDRGIGHSLPFVTFAAYDAASGLGDVAVIVGKS
jgi:hypothetical protein